MCISHKDNMVFLNLSLETHFIVNNLKQEKMNNKHHRNCIDHTCTTGSEPWLIFNVKSLIMGVTSGVS